MRDSSVPGRMSNWEGLVHWQRSPGGEIGRRNGLKIRYPQGCAGSIPAPGTNLEVELQAELDQSLIKG